MDQAVLRVMRLPEAPLDAAAKFHRDDIPQARNLLSQADALAIVFPPAGKPHLGWRLAVVQELAREEAPKRVNAVAGEDEEAIAQALEYLARAPSVTGQLLPVEL